MASAIASSMKQWTITGTEKGFDDLKLETVTVPQVGENEVLVKMNAVSLNYRDLIIPKGQYPFPANIPIAACSDGAGEVVAVGSKVSKWNNGDSVLPLFHQSPHYGSMNAATMKTSLGGMIDGTLRHYSVYNENGLVRQPANLSFVEASTLPCAALTAWNALYGLKPLKPGQTVLVQGTGGVSCFGIQFAKAAGAKVIATTSSNDKVKKIKELGADHVLNYKEDEKWGETARKVSAGGEGVDHILDVGGPATLEQSLKAIKFEGMISIIGFLGAASPKGNPQILDALSHICTFRGVFLGSGDQMEEMVQAIEANDIHPLVDEVFPFDKARESFEYLWDQKHFGKVAIKIE